MLPRILLASTFFAGLSACATQPPIAFSSSEACTASSPTYDSREVRCQFPKTDSVRKFRFKANFSGGHDDTMARIEPFFDNAPLNCDTGSKTNLFAEDGEVSLWCTFSVADQMREGGIFKVTIRWSHAEYMNYEVAEQ